MKEIVYDEATVKIYSTREEMAAAAAAEVAAAMRGLLARNREMGCIFASAPSQDEFLRHLMAQPGVDWDRMNAVHMDEYIGVTAADPHSFGHYLEKAVFSQAAFKSVNLIDGLADAEEECRRYAALLEKFAPAVTLMGIGENGHIAFNDPPVADFNDPKTVKKVLLDDACKRQQVNDGCFPTLADVPAHAITLTVPALLRPERVFCMVPGPRKAEAVRAALTGPVGEKCPASALRRKPGAMIYLDADAASKLP